MKFIECKEDREFTIKIQVQEPYKFDCPNLGFCIMVDGDWIDMPLLNLNAWDYEDRD